MAVKKKPIARAAGSSPVVDAAHRAKAPEPQAERASAEADREARIRSAAYAAAERRGFVPGQEMDDWLAAERVIDGETSAGTSASP